MATIREAVDLPTLLEEVRKRPALFLGQKTVLGLKLFLSGIWFAESYHVIPENQRIRGFDLEAFEEWVAARHNPQRLSRDSLSLPEHVAGSDAEGLDLWFSWYDDYRTSSLAKSQSGEDHAVA